MAGTYRAVAERTGARVIVDTSKMPGEAALLSHLDGVTFPSNPSASFGKAISWRRAALPRQARRH